MKGKVSKTGYKRNSPDKNNDYNIIPSGRITMQDVDFPVYGVDEYGNSQMMYPGGEYEFPGNEVFEIPMAQRGRQLSTSTGYDSWYNSPIVAGRYTFNPKDPAEYYVEGYGTKQGPGIAAGMDYTNPKYRTQGMIRVGLDPEVGANLRLQGGYRFNPIDNRREQLTWGPYGGSRYQTENYFQEPPSFLAYNNLQPDLVYGVNARYNKALANRGRFNIEGDLGMAIGLRPEGNLGEGFDPRFYGAVKATYSPPMYKNTRNRKPGPTTYSSGYQDGGDIPIAQRGMSTRRIDRILNENKNLNWVQRLYEPNTPSIQIPGLGGPSTHYMESGDGRVYPTVVQMPDGNLQYLGEDAYDYANRTGEYIQFKNDRQAQRFAKSYKKGTNVLPQFQLAGSWRDVSNYGYTTPQDNTAYTPQVIPNEYRPAPQQAIKRTVAPSTRPRVAPTNVNPLRPETQSTQDNTAYVAPPPLAPTLTTANNWRQPTISAYNPPSFGEYMMNKLANPMTTLGYLARGESMPDMVPSKGNSLDIAMDFVNPIAWFDYGMKGVEDIKAGNYLQGGLEMLSVIPLANAASKATPTIMRGVNAGTNMAVRLGSRYAPRTTEAVLNSATNITNRGANSLDRLSQNLTSRLNQVQQLPPPPSEINLSIPEFKLNRALRELSVRDRIRQDAWNNALRSNPELASSSSYENFLRKDLLRAERLGNTPEYTPRRGIVLDLGPEEPIRPNFVSLGPELDKKVVFNTTTFKPILKDAEAITTGQFIQDFNSNINRLNSIVARNNVSPIEYRFNGIQSAGSHSGRLEWVRPEQTIGGVFYPETTGSWSVGINPGRWTGEVKDLHNIDYYKSIPGLDMTATTQSIRPEGSNITGMRSYQSINEYLKELELGRVKPGFNSQSSSSYPLWGNAIKKGQASGYEPPGGGIWYGAFYQDGGEKRQPTSWLDYANPMNWGVYTYDDAGTFDQAFAKARGEGQDEFMWYGTRYNTQLAQPQTSGTTSAPKPAVTTKPNVPAIDLEALKRGIQAVESANGKLMKNPESSATGLYGQLFSELTGTGLYSGTRDAFALDLDAQNRIFDERFNNGINGNPSLSRNARDLYVEYLPVLQKNKISIDELAALSNFLGRQGTRNYLGYVLRDGKTLAQALPALYGPNAQYKNKTPEAYLEKYRIGRDQEFKKGGEKIQHPSYDTAESFSKAWMQARKDLGKGKSFSYGGIVYKTSTTKGY